MNGDLFSKKKEIVELFMKKGVLVSSEILTELEDESKVLKIYDAISKISSEGLAVLGGSTESLMSILNIDNINWLELDRSKVLVEKGIKNANESVVDSIIHSDAPKIQKISVKEGVKVTFSYVEQVKKRDFQDFVDYFNNRYQSIENLLKGRQEMSNATSISRALSKKTKESLSIIGLVSNKQYTKNNNLMLTIEDPTGSINVLVSKNKAELFRAAGSIVLDEIIGISGVSGEKIIFANNILWPDIPAGELKRCEDEVYCAFLSDLHVGSSKFLPDEFNKFLGWINGEVGNEQQKNIAKNVKYIFIVGDLVDGCGIYPEQDKELEIPDIYAQYRECARLLRKIPPHIPLIVCPGNHDAVRVAEPQPVLPKTFAAPLHEMPNTILVSNPAMINIHSSDGFSGFDVLLYHGYSFDHFVAEVDYLRNNGGYDRADLIMKFLLQRRHLAPTHTSTLYIPDIRKDYLVIEKVPDFFVSGHIHKSINANYKNVTMICGSCWQSKTAFQEKVGHNPEPSRVPVVNLKTREVKILKFGH